MKINCLSMVFFLAACFLMTTCQKDDVGASLSDYNGKAALRLNCDPCEADFIFGPQTLERSAGKPVNIVRVFDMGEEADVCLTVTNDRVASARIMIDEEEVFSPNDFNQNVATLQVTAFLGAGTHQVAIMMNGKPGGTITLTLRGCISEPPPPLLCSEVAANDCVGKGWYIVAVYPDEGTLYCTADGRSEANNCDTYSFYNIYMWKDGAPEHFCPEDGTFEYSTRAGGIYAGHNPCICGDNLFSGLTWDMRGCIPD